VGSKVIRNVTKILKATSGRLFGRVTSGTGRAEELTPSDVRTLIAFDESVDDRVSALLAAGTNITITYNDAANTLTIASTAGGLSGTGSVDNAVLRADGTGGATLQNSSWVINDNLTASPNNTVNHACLEATGGTTNVSVSIKPKGTGAFCLSAPDGTATGGNIRGANAVDLQTARTAATQVASGPYSFAAGYRATASGPDGGAAAIGDNVIASGSRAFACGHQTQATGNFSFASNLNSIASGTQSFAASGTASGTGSVCLAGATTASGANSIARGDGSVAAADLSSASGSYARSYRYAEHAFGNGFFSAGGDRQASKFVLANRTTNATPTTLFLDGSSLRLSLAATPGSAGRVASYIVQVLGVKSDGSACAVYVRRVAIKNVGGTTSLVGSVETIGTDIEDNPSTDIAITADNTNDALQINVTGIASETWRWVAVVEGVEVAYGT
jgi:hypothetical protein